MNLESMTCPKCGAPLNFNDPEQEYCFCSSCGNQVYKEDIHYDKRIELEKEKLKYQHKENILYVIIIIGTLILGGFGYFLMFMNSMTN